MKHGASHNWFYWPSSLFSMLVSSLSLSLPSSGESTYSLSSLNSGKLKKNGYQSKHCSYLKFDFSDFATDSSYLKQILANQMKKGASHKWFYWPSSSFSMFVSSSSLSSSSSGESSYSLSSLNSAKLKKMKSISNTWNPLIYFSFFVVCLIN